MKIKELIKDKDYSYISIRSLVSQNDENIEDMFVAAYKSENGQLIYLYGHQCSEDEEVLKFEEWDDEKIKNGLIIIINQNLSTESNLNPKFKNIEGLRKNMCFMEAIYFCDNHDCEECPMHINHLDIKSKSERRRGIACCEKLMK